MSWKNKLQEVYQKKHLPSPSYDTHPVMHDNNLRFQSTVIVHGCNRSFTSDLFTNKSDSQSHAAHLAYLHVVDNVKHYTTIYLIDLENVPFHTREFSDDILYIGCTSSNHNAIKKYDDWYRPNDTNHHSNVNISNKLLFIVDGKYKDLADHLLTMLSVSVVTYVKLINIRTDIHIITSDNAGRCTCKCLKMESEFQGVRKLVSVHLDRL